MGKCPMEEFYNQIRQWFNPVKHAGMLPAIAEKIPEEWFTPADGEVTTEIPEHDRDRSRPRVSEHRRSGDVVLLPGESRGYWKHHSPGKWFRQAKITGKINNEKSILLLETGAEVSIVDTAFARKVGCYVDTSQSQECVVIGESVYMTEGRTRVKVTLAGSLVHFFDIWVGDLSGQEAILGMDFMVPAGIRLDLADGSICLPDEVNIQLSRRRQLYNDNVRHVCIDQGMQIAIGDSIELPLRMKMTDREKLWVTRGDRWVPTVVRGPGRIRYLQVTNISDKDLVLHRNERIAMWLAGDRIPRIPGYVSIGSRRYMEWQNLAFQATTDDRPTNQEAPTGPPVPAVERPNYPTPRAILQRRKVSPIIDQSTSPPDPTSEPEAMSPDPGATVVDTLRSGGRPLQDDDRVTEESRSSASTVLVGDPPDPRSDPVESMGKCPMEEFYNQIRQWFNPVKHAGMLPAIAEKIPEEWFTPADGEVTTEIPEHDRDRSRPRVSEHRRSGDVVLLPGESRGYWKHHSPGKWFRQAKITGKINNEKSILLLDTGAEVSIVDTAFARKVGCYVDTSQSQECVVIGESVYMTEGRTRVKVTLAGSLVHFFDIWVGDLSGQEAILGMDFMVPAGIRLDLADGSICLPDEVNIQLSRRRQLYNDNVRHVCIDQGMQIAIGDSIELPLRMKMTDREKLWVTRGDRWVPTVVRGPGRIRYLQVTNISDKDLVLHRNERIAMWLAGDRIPRIPGYVSIGSRRYMEWQNLAFQATTDDRPTNQEAPTGPPVPAVERPNYPTPRAILQRRKVSPIIDQSTSPPDPTSEPEAMSPDPGATVVDTLRSGGRPLQDDDRVTEESRSSASTALVGDPPDPRSDPVESVCEPSGLMEGMDLGHEARTKRREGRRRRRDWSEGT
ncbi:hypothetical protein PHYSODRAFT_330843 [Phytophthora sojae]|uniref:Peptidase A2 domain-containing protein n=1 Tax=Phytophthora sojae (strain P6497) TaxID=1094619 RepID=G4ZHT9_PHYSP|nr:hypothetical protein PHYSODRAFT_330843 [Phytophthora sojae]EGZ16784.1 hypothetical protein PHYSODRAFT_330843 [Phytophthora sojae]|eukprot:XP_009525842.1 hypothetical protein PHYSODRAFT_330843 [Phytophthora sojae]